MRDQKPRKRRATPPLTVGWLRSEAVAYLQRWPASEVRVRRLLWKRIRRAQSFHGGTDEEAAPLVEEVIVALVDGRMLDDMRFATLWVDSLRRRGTSARAIRFKLREKGVAGNLIQAAIDAHEPDEEGATAESSERAAARAYAKRRRLGSYRVVEDASWERKRKDLASMARAGFSFDVAKSVLEG
jgi:regulatory protein